MPEAEIKAVNEEVEIVEEEQKTEEEKSEPSSEEEVKTEVKEESEPEKESKEKPDRPKKNHEAEAEKWRNKYHEQQDKYTQSLEEKSDRKTVEEEPKFQQIGVNSFTPEHWNQVLAARGVELETISEADRMATINSIIHQTNTDAKIAKMESEQTTFKRDYAENFHLTGLDTDTKSKVKAYLSNMNADPSKAEQYSKQVEMAKRLVQQETGIDFDKIKEDLTNDLQISPQPETTSSVKKSTIQYKWSAESEKARLNFGQTKQEWAENQ